MIIPNPLDNFRSHSVHYILLAARTTEDLRQFVDESDGGQASALQAIDNCQALGGVVKNKNSSESVFLVMDTRRFAQFSIENFEIDTRIAGFNVPGSQSPNAVALDMMFTVLDSSGISFANFLQYLMDQKLKVSFDGMSLLMKVIFVGHTDDNKSKIVQSISVPAIFKTIELDLNGAKGVYTCHCIPLLGMPSNARYNAKWTSIGTASSYFTGKNANTLGDVIQSFEDRLNDLSMSLYNKFNGIIQYPGQSPQTAKQFGRPVQYMITIPDSWKPFKFSGPSKGGAQEINFQQLLKQEEASKNSKTQPASNAEAKESLVAVDPNLTIPEILDTIFSQTIDVQKLANFSTTKNKTDLIKFYKHLITITSNDDNFTVHVDVVEFSVPNVLLAEQKKAAVTVDDAFYTTIPATSTSASKKVPKNYLEYDYIFSGKNIDILNLDLKIENLNLLLMQGTKIGQGKLFEQADKGQNQTDGSVGEDISTIVGRGAKDPIPLRMLTAAERSNFSNLAGSVKIEGEQTPQAVVQQYTKNLSDLYNTVTQAHLTLRGNPSLLAGVVLTGIPQHVNAISNVNSNNGASKVNLGVKAGWRTDLENRLIKTGSVSKTSDGFQVLGGQSFVTTPVFMKVNVYTQDVNFLSLDPASGQQNFAKQLFSDNYYLLFGIKSRIEGSRFTQECEIRSFSIYGHQEVTAKGQTQSTTKDLKK